PAHGHDWCVIVHISSHRLDKMGLVMNFQKLKAMLNEAVKDFEEVDLDAIDYFRRNNPSAENVAKYVYERLGGRLPKTVKLRTVSVMEEPSCWASYSVE
ncbi:MAG: 6-carboxytetrahydropterin synthase, partial [Sedimentisphaerales bacterium]